MDDGIWLDAHESFHVGFHHIVHVRKHFRHDLAPFVPLHPNFAQTRNERSSVALPWEATVPINRSSHSLYRRSLPMSESTLSSRFCAHASLAAIGKHLHAIDLLAPIREKLHIKQKTVKYTPVDKITDAFILLLTGAHRMVEINTKLRANPALVEAFGKCGCAEQSVVQDTLDACKDDNIEQMQQAVNTIFREHSQALKHDYHQHFQLLDLDLSGRECGQGAEDATKGYFPDHLGASGRQEGRVYASWYDETVCVRLFTGNTTTAACVQPLLKDAQEAFDFTPQQRERTIVRMDAGGGTVEEVNACLSAGYQFHGKEFSTARATHLAATVHTWYPDPDHPGREVGMVTVEPSEDVRPLVRIAQRWSDKKGQLHHCVLLSTLDAEAVLSLEGAAGPVPTSMEAGLLAYTHFYDARGGGIECAFKQDQQGLGRRNKKCFAAQAVLLWLECLAHNVLIWARDWLAPRAPVIAGYGLLRLVRDALSIPDCLSMDAKGGIRALVLSRAHPLAAKLLLAFQQLLAPQQIPVCLGEI